MLNRRLQVLIDDERYERLASQAREQGVSVGEIVREAIDRFVPGVSRRKARAAHLILEAPPMPVPDVEELKQELDQLRGRRG